MLDITAEYLKVTSIFHSRFAVLQRKGGRSLLLDREECTQDFLLDLHRKQLAGSKFDPARASLTTYLFMVSDQFLWKAVKHISRRGRGLTDLGFMDDISISMEPLLLQEFTDPEARIELKKVLSLIEDLPETDRQVVMDSIIEGRTYKEIGDSLGCSKSWVGQVVKRSLKGVRASLEASHD